MVGAKAQGLMTQRFNSLTQFGLLLFLLVGVVFFCRGWKGLYEIVKPMFEWRRSVWLYVMVVFWTLGIGLIVLTVQSLIGAVPLTFESIKPGLAKITNPKLMTTLIISSFIGEMVWISYTLRKLSFLSTPFVSALVVGFAWTMWWLPMAIFNYSIIPNLPLLGLLINQTGVAAMCAFVYYHTRSGLLILIMQICFNSTLLLLPITPTPDANGTYWAFAITYFAAAVGLFMKFGPLPLFGSLKLSIPEKLMGKRVENDIYT